MIGAAAIIVAALIQSAKIDAKPAPKPRPQDQSAVVSEPSCSSNRECAVCHHGGVHSVAVPPKRKQLAQRKEDEFPSNRVIVVPWSESVLRVEGRATVATGELVVVPQKLQLEACAPPETPYSLVEMKTDPVNGVVAPAISVEEVHPSQAVGCQPARQGELVFEGVDE